MISGDLFGEHTRWYLSVPATSENAMLRQQSSEGRYFAAAGRVEFIRPDPWCSRGLEIDLLTPGNFVGIVTVSE